LCIRFTPKAVAAAAIYYAALRANIDLKSFASDPEKASSYQLFPDASRQEIEAIISEFDSLYNSRQKTAS
jgi:hypothetical protein